MDRRQFLQAGALGALLPAGHSRAADDSANQVRRYRRLGRTEFEISDISFGSSRLRRGEEHLVHHALDRGINYFDGADSYTGGASEEVLGRALRGRRDQVYLVSKTKAWPDTRHGEIMAALDGSLRRLGTDYVDVYLNHAVNDIERLDNPEWGEFVERAKAAGKIRATGMSGHAGRLIDCLDHAIDRDLADVILVAYNFGQDPAFYEQFTRSFNYVAKQPDLPRVLEKAKAKDVGVVTMKTLMGARLNDMRPYETDGATFAQAAFRWTLSNPNVDALVISMTERALIDEYLGASGARAVTGRDVELLRHYARLNGTSYCRHACNDCAGACPYGVPIADVLRTRMYATDYEDLAFARSEYAGLAANASACLGCSGAPCQDACSHGLPVAELCAPTHRMLS
ncbi:MAG: aldo/keto reductase [Gammaproteobacteria bacterium]|nr:aldo/keto reductase [Gammaproteobacteria bacterium]